MRPPRRHVSHRRHRAWRTRPGRQTGGPLTPLAPVPFLSFGPGGSRPGERRHSARNCRYPGRSPRARCLVRAVTAPRTGTGPADRLARPAGSLLAPSTLSLLAVAPALSAVRYRVPRRNVRGHPLVSLPGIPGCLVRGIRLGSAHATQRLNWVSHRNQLSGLFDPGHRPELLISCPRNTGGSEPCLGQHLLGPLALRRVVAVNPGPPRSGVDAPRDESPLLSWISRNDRVRESQLSLVGANAPLVCFLLFRNKNWLFPFSRMSGTARPE